jgi:hypothetical protein
VTMALWDGFGGVEMEGWTTETDAGSRHTEHARTHARTTEQRAEAETGPTAAAKLGIVHGLQVKSTGASPGSANKTQFQGLVSGRGARRCT